MTAFFSYSSPVALLITYVCSKADNILSDGGAELSIARILLEVFGQRNGFDPSSDPKHSLSIIL